MDPLDEQDILSRINQMKNGWGHAMDMHFLEATPDAVTIEWTVSDKHLQPFGIVHGGVHAGAIETVCSIGAGIAARAKGFQGSVVGLENHTSFIRAVGPGTVLRARAVPVTRGRTTHVWRAEVTDTKGRVIAQGTVRLLCVTPDQLGSKTTVGS